jgi:outer membrane receptor protein involved in Fe transport
MSSKRGADRVSWSDPFIHNRQWGNVKTLARFYGPICNLKYPLSISLGCDPGKIAVAAALVGALGMPIGTATAAEGPADDTGALQEIVVTASKRESNLQNTAISITALTGEALQERGLSGLTDVIHETPGVSFRTNGGPGQTEIQMRGMTSTGGEAPTVGFYLDEVPVTPAAQSDNGKVVLDPNLFDLKRVEVLRGPQGTLYGSGSMGGTIRLIINQPDLKRISVNAQTIFSDTDAGGFNRAENGALNLPLLEDKVALRIVYSDSHSAGWIDRVVLNPFPLPTNPDPACGPVYGCTRGDVLAAPVQAKHRNVNDLQTTGARATLLIQPFERLSIEPMILYQHNSAGGVSAFDTVPGTLAHYEPFDVPEPISDNFTLYSGTVKYHFDSVDITSVSAKWTRESNTYQDFAEQMQEVFFTPAYEIEKGGLGGGQALDQDKVSQFSQELRVSSNWQGPLKALLGVFYSKYDSLLYFNASLPGAPDVLGQETISVQIQPTKIKQEAIFGEASYKFTDQLEATVGLRRYKYDSQLAVTAYGAALGNDVGTPITSFNKTSNVGYNPKFNLSYTPSDKDLLYATAAKGFRPGAANGPVPLAGPTSCVDSLAALGRTTPPSAYDPDSVWSYEIGNKLQMQDRRVILNTAAYFERWTGIQQQISLPCGWLFTDNQGTANIYGGEVELAARVTSALTLSLNAAYTHAALTEDVPEAGGVKGQQLQDIPKFTGGASIEYSVPVSANYKFISRLSDDYIGDRHDAYGPLPGYNLMDFRIGLSGDPWTVHLFAKNLTNRIVNVSNPIPLSVSTPLYMRAVSNQPAMFGVDISFRY